jgi:predicted secreted hydrolase
MNKLRWGFLGILHTILLMMSLVACTGVKPGVKLEPLGLPDSSGDFMRVTGPVELQFPRDYGSHPDYQTEWWYFTGNLTGDKGESYGYELTFFRRGLGAPSGSLGVQGSNWTTNQVYMAHFALTDIAGNKFYNYERLERGVLGLAGAQGAPKFSVWLDDWSVEQRSSDVFHLTAGEQGMAIDLVLTDLKGPVLQGDHGYSQKGPDPGNASIYVSLTRLQTAGRVAINGQSLNVSGLSWMDHEFGTSTLSADQVGWDWFSIQLDDNSELMVYTIRRSDGTIDKFSKGTLVYSDGSIRPLEAKDFQVVIKGSWRSPHSGGVYPAGWEVTIPSENLTLEIKPRLPDQELNLSTIYWEGAVSIVGSRDGRDVKGIGYVELTGYAQSLEGRF